MFGKSNYQESFLIKDIFKIQLPLAEKFQTLQKKISRRFSYISS